MEKQTIRHPEKIVVNEIIYNEPKKEQLELLTERGYFEC